MEIDYFNSYPDYLVVKQFWNITENNLFKFLKQKAMNECRNNIQFQIEKHYYERVFTVSLLGFEKIGFFKGNPGGKFGVQKVEIGCSSGPWDLQALKLHALG